MTHFPLLINRVYSHPKSIIALHCASYRHYAMWAQHRSLFWCLAIARTEYTEKTNMRRGYGMDVYWQSTLMERASINVNCRLSIFLFCLELYISLGSKWIALSSWFLAIAAHREEMNCVVSYTINPTEHQCRQRSGCNSWCKYMSIFVI